MDGIQEVDNVFQHVRQAIRRFRLPADAAITQQILLLGDAFYGYRFTATDFRAIWSVADQTLKVFDHYGQMLEFVSLSDNVAETKSMPSPQYKAA